ncbi:MAG: hypothetical protein AAGF11_24585 [Myxococcota bacterium]
MFEDDKVRTIAEMDARIHRNRWRASATVALVLTSSAWTVHPVHAALPSVSFAVCAPSTTGSPRSELSSTERARQQREAGDYAAAARSYAAAFDALSEPEQMGDSGTIMVDEATKDFARAQQQNPQDLALLNEEAALLERYQEVRARGYEKGLCDPIEPDFDEELKRVRRRIDKLHDNEKIRRLTEANEEQQAKLNQFEAEKLDAEQIAAEQAARQQRAVSPPPAEPEPVRLAVHRADLALLSSGSLAVLGGTALIVVGAWDLDNVSKEAARLRETLDRAPADNDPESDQTKADVSTQIKEWEQRYTRTGTAFVVSGAILAAGGIGLLTWGAIRHRRRTISGQRRATLDPMLSRRVTGLRFSLRF